MTDLLHPCDDCGEHVPTRNPYGNNAPVIYRVCRECYLATPEPDTGRPDWEDLSND